MARAWGVSWGESWGSSWGAAASGGGSTTRGGTPLKGGNLLPPRGRKKKKRKKAQPMAEGFSDAVEIEKPRIDVSADQIISAIDNLGAFNVDLSDDSLEQVGGLLTSLGIRLSQADPDFEFSDEEISLLLSKLRRIEAEKGKLADQHMKFLLTMLLVL